MSSSNTPLLLPYYTKPPHARWQLMEQTESYFKRIHVVKCKRLRMFSKGKQWDAGSKQKIPEFGMLRHVILQVIVRNDLGEYLKIRMSCFHGLDHPSYAVIHESNVLRYEQETGYTQLELLKRLYPALGVELLEQVFQAFAERWAKEAEKAETRKQKPSTGEKKGEKKVKDRKAKEVGPRMDYMFRSSICYQKLRKLAGCPALEVTDNTWGREWARIRLFFKQREQQEAMRATHPHGIITELPQEPVLLHPEKHPYPTPQIRVLFQINKAQWCPERFLEEALKVDGGDWKVVDGKTTMVKRKKQELHLVSLIIKESE